MPVYLAEAASASYSREREMAIWISMAAMGARIIMAIAPMHCRRRGRRGATAAEKEGHAGQHGDGGGERGGHGADEDIAVQHVAELVGHDAFDLAVVHDLQDAGR